MDHGAPPLGSADLGGEGIGGTDGTPGWMTRTAIDPTGRWALVVTAGGEPIVIDLALPPLAAPSIRIPLVVDAAPAWSLRHRAFVVSAVAAPGGAASPISALWKVAPDGRFEVIPGTDGAVGPVGVGPDGSIAVTLRRPGDGPGRDRCPCVGRNDDDAARSVAGVRRSMAGLLARWWRDPGRPDIRRPAGGRGRHLVRRPGDGGREAARHGRGLRSLASLTAGECMVRATAGI